ncbi:unnamed protein product [Tenebrio molitor]|nr:unnamed protein product [Tenebrio molitor]
MTRKNPSLLKALIKTFWAEFFTYGIIHFFSEIALLIFQPFCLKKLLDYFAKEEPLVSRQDAYMYAAFFALLATLYVITLNSLVFELLVLGMKVRVACASLIYRHSLSLSSYTFVKTTIGQIINLLSNDLKRFDSLFPFLPFLLWITPVELVLGVYIVDFQLTERKLR